MFMFGTAVEAVVSSKANLVVRTSAWLGCASHRHAFVYQHPAHFIEEFMR